MIQSGARLRLVMKKSTPGTFFWLGSSVVLFWYVHDRIRLK